MQAVVLTWESLVDFPQTLCFSVNALKDSIQQISCLGLLFVHMCRIPSLKCLSADLSCKKLLASFLAHGEQLGQLCVGISINLQVLGDLFYHFGRRVNA